DLTSSFVDPGCKQKGPDCVRLRELFTLVPDVEDPRSLAFSEDGKNLAVGGPDSVQFWDVSRKEPSRQLDPASTLIFPSENKLIPPEEKVFLLVEEDEVSQRNYDLKPLLSFT